jgi:hypothetical protein
MLPAPSIVCRVLRPLMSPIVAHPGDVLTAWPGHPRLTLCVLSPDASRVLRAQYVPEGRLYADLLTLFLDAAIDLSDAGQAALLTRSA